MTISTIATFITEISVLLGVVVGVVAFCKKIAEGVKCLLRNKMLEIYNRHKDIKTIGRYDFENFEMLYRAYKALKGNSFIDEIYKIFKTWKIEAEY